jgi:hypothetical protein
MKAQMYWTGAQQLAVARHMLRLILVEKYETLKAFREAAAACSKPHNNIRSLQQLSMLGRSFIIARLEALRLIQEGTYFKPKVESLVDLVMNNVPVGTHVCGVEKSIGEFIARERKPYVLVVGAIPSQHRFILSSLSSDVDAKFWAIGESYNALRSLALGAERTLVWVDKINHTVSDVIKAVGHYEYVSGISSIKQQLSH